MLRQSVVLIHGLWLNSLVMYPLQRRIARHGFRVHQFGYPTVREGLTENAKRLSKFIDAIDAEAVHIVAHSLGGLVTMSALHLHGNRRVRRIVLLGCPITGSLSGRRLARFRGGRMLLGSSSGHWEAREAAIFPDYVKVGVIAGTRRFGLGQLVGKLPRPNDGVVTVAETEVVNETDRLILGVTHSEMLVSAEVARQVCSFLHNAHFIHGGVHEGMSADATHTSASQSSVDHSSAVNTRAINTRVVDRGAIESRRR